MKRESPKQGRGSLERRVQLTRQGAALRKGGSHKRTTSRKRLRGKTVRYSSINTLRREKPDTSKGAKGRKTPSNLLREYLSCPQWKDREINKSLTGEITQVCKF